jgi:SPP1 family predicted phage head-tail adaptor
MATYRIGELDQRIEFYRKVRTPDGQGGFTTSEVLQTTVWALIRATGGNEVFKYEKLEAPASYMFVIRYNSELDIREDDLIKWNGDSYNIRSIQQRSTRRMYLEIVAERGVAQ